MFNRLIDWFHNQKFTPKVKVTIIGSVIAGLFLVLATGILNPIVTGIFNLITGAGKTRQVSMNGSQVIQGNLMQDAKNVTINQNYFSQDSSVKDVIKEFDKRLFQTDSKIELTRNELELLSKALNDLDQRTSGIKKLPDGRTQFGAMISGVPSVIIEEQNLSALSFQKSDFEKSLEHSQKAIEAYENTKDISATIVSGSLEPKEASKIYRLAAMAAQRANKKDLAYQYATNSFNLNSSPSNTALLSTTLANLNKSKEALEYINKALAEEPANQEYLEIKRFIQRGLK